MTTAGFLFCGAGRKAGLFAGKGLQDQLRVNALLMPIHTPVQMGTCGAASRTHQSNRLTTSDSGALGNQKTAEMKEAGAEAMTMIDNHCATRIE